MNGTGLIRHEDEHLLVINKPAGMNTHSPAPFAGEGIYDWLRHREPRWASLGLIHRLDKETSGALVFAKTTEANRSLTEQFAGRKVRKTYLLLTDRPVKEGQFVVRSALVRAGQKYVSRPQHAGGASAETVFRRRGTKGGLTELEAEPLTGRTHQIRVHAADRGIPILGDTLYGGSPAGRVYLHAEAIAFSHPATGESLEFRVPADFEMDPRATLRAAVVSEDKTNAWRIVHGDGDGWPAWYVDKLGDFLLSQCEHNLRADQLDFLRKAGARGVYHKQLTRHVRQKQAAESSPQHLLGEPAPERFAIRENGLCYEASFAEGYSVGLFLDQRENRRRLLVNHVGAGFRVFQSDPRQAEVLNAFAYTCGFSVCAGRAGARVTSLDLSKKYLEWGRRNFTCNELDAARHDFIYGDAFDWLRRLHRKNRAFDVIILDPPTFSQSKEHGIFRAEKDYGKLIRAALPLLKPGGVLFASTNAAGWAPEEFLGVARAAVVGARRRIDKEHYFPQPPDFPITRSEPAYLKTVWMRLV